MTASKSGNHIYVNGTGNTLASITSDIADTTFIEQTSPGVFVVKGNVTRYLYIRSGGELTIGDSKNYSISETLEFENLANGRNRLDVQHNSKFSMFGASVLDFSTSAYYPTYSRFQGHVTIKGDGTDNPKLQHPYKIYLNSWDNNNDTGTFGEDSIELFNVTLASVHSNDNYFFVFDSMTKVMSMSFKNILCDRSLSSRNIQRSRYFYFGTHWRGMEDIVLENINFNDVGYGCLNYGANVTFKNCTYGTSYSWKTYDYYARPTGIQMIHYYDTTSEYMNERVGGQAFSFYDNCTYSNSSSTNRTLVGRNATVLFRDCDWLNTSGESIQLDNTGVAMFWTGNTWADTTPLYDVNSMSCINWVYGLDLTVEDVDGNSLEGATVYIEQKDGRESLLFMTKSNGKLDQLFDLEVALLTNKHQYSDSSSEYWSDSSNSTYHNVTVLKDGYRPYTTTVVMDADKSETITMKRLDNYSLSF